MTEYNVRMKELTCPICSNKIDFTGDTDFDCGGGMFYLGECKHCEIDFRIYQDQDDYDVWYEV